MTAEAEHREGDDGLSGVEPERHPDDESDLRVHRLDEGVGQAVCSMEVTIASRLRTTR